MVKKTKIQKKPKEDNKHRKNVNLSLITKKTHFKLLLNNKYNISTLNTTIIFKVNDNPLLQDKIDIEYYKLYILYLKEEMNSKIITMFFNYISLSKVIPNSFKNDRYFLQEFLKILVNLLINEIDLVIVTLLLDTLGWIEHGSEPWVYIYYISLIAKEKTTSGNTFSILMKILDKNNKGFKESFLQWRGNKNILNILQQIEITKTNERLRDLMKPINLNKDQIKYINYNELVNRIIMNSKKKENIPPSINDISNINNNNINNSITPKKKNIIINNKFNQYNYNPFKQPINQMNPLDVIPYHRGLIYNYNKYGSPSKIAKQPLLDIQQNSSFYNDKFFDLSRNGSRNNSFFSFNSFDGDLSKMSSMRFNNK